MKKENIEKIASAQNEAIELLKEEKIEDAIAKMQEVAEEIKEVSTEVEETEEIEEKETETEEKENKETEEVSKTSVETEVQKWADAYIGWEDFKAVLTQIIEASDLMKKVEEVAKQVEELKWEENSETSKDPAEVEKTEDPNSVWEWL